MSLDTKYRPTSWNDVLGQDGIKKVLRRFVATGAGFRQSYLFSGPFGSGKTTLARVLARALLCENPTPEGDPCDQCVSCKSMLENGTSLNFTEVDAATNSGVEAMRKITEDVQYASFSGNRRLYLFDESHQLSNNALDAMLKPLEENVPGSSDKRLVCIFCTTEPEKMRATILSRCAPAFVIQPVSPEDIAQRLAWVCEQEKIEFELPMLQLIAEATECHIRDALKAIEGVSMLGAVNETNVRSYLHLDLNNLYLEVIENIGNDLSKALDGISKILERVSPVTCYERLVEVSMMAYQSVVGNTKTPAYWDHDRLKDLGTRQGTNLLGIASRLASRPGRPNSSMLMCDIAHLHHVGGLYLGDQPTIVPQTNKIEKTFSQNSEKLGKIPQGVQSTSYDGVSVSPMAVKTGARSVLNTKPENLSSGLVVSSGAGAFELTPSEFSYLLALRIAELGGEQRVGST